jgi:hypothetical protein
MTGFSAKTIQVTRKGSMNVDFHHVEEKHNAIHSALLNWSRWVTVRHNIGHVHPMWAKSRSNAWQWHQPVQRESTNSIEAQRMEKLVQGLPDPHRNAIRWAYVYRTKPVVACRVIGTSYEGLAQFVRDGRQMLCNRGGV